MLTLEIPAPCEPLNSNQRLHHMVKAKRTAAWRARAHVAAIQAGRPKLERAHVRAHIARTDNRSFDAGNWYPTVKACLDGIVQAGCLPDDSNAYVTGPDLRPAAKAEKFTITITLDPDCTCADCGYRPCPRCGDPTDEGSDDKACMVAHCLECMGRCNACQDDMTQQGEL